MSKEENPSTRPPLTATASRFAAGSIKFQTQLSRTMCGQSTAHVGQSMQRSRSRSLRSAVPPPPHSSLLIPHCCQINVHLQATVSTQYALPTSLYSVALGSLMQIA
ncbi:hypothetical protein J6590_014388 [Homalodisca vitripennis]|nr:hypothetical protein J6590_014388 [Homalodisca vitripennis]